MYTMNFKIGVITRLFVIMLYLNSVGSLTIDNQLTVIRNDCYERLAIGEKINPKEIDKTLTLKTVQDCQMACTQEQEECRTFSFGIGVKGNGTCELSKTVIKETPDLKPIGTVSDVEFDLYIKKLGCKLVLSSQESSSSNSQPLPESTSVSNEEKPEEKPLYPSIPSNDYGSSKPPSYNHDYREPPYYGSVRPTYAPERPYDDNSAGPNYNLGKPFRVQSSLIGVASKPSFPSRPSVAYTEKDGGYRPSRYGMGRPYYPNRFSSPEFDRSPNYYDFRDDRPPFRPPVLNHPYDDWLDREPHFVPHQAASEDRFDSSLYGHGSRPNRPDSIPERPVGLDHYGQRPINRPEYIPEVPFAYGSSPNRPPFVPERPYLSERPHIRPRPERPPENADPYGEGPRPQRPDEIPERPFGDTNYYEYGPHRPDVPERPTGASGIYESRPQRPDIIPERPLSDSEHYNIRPNRPSKIPQRPIGNWDAYGQAGRPQKPNIVPNRPISDSGNYESKPYRPQEVPLRPIGDSEDYDHGIRPHPPSDIPLRPIGDFGIYEIRPHRPDIIPQKPLGDSDGYGQGSKPHRPHDVPERPFSNFDHYDSRPHRPHYRPDRPFIQDYDSKPSLSHRPSDVYQEGSRPQRPQEIPDRPLGETSIYGSRPYRPDVIPEKPVSDSQTYGHGAKPTPPQEIPERPLGDFEYGGSSKPNRPFDIPNRPLSNPDDYGSRPYRPYHIPYQPTPDRPYDSDRYKRPFYNDREDYGYYRPHYSLKRPRPVRPITYETDFERPIFVPIKPVYSYGRTRPNEITNVAQNISKETNSSVLHNSISSNSSNVIESNIIEESDRNKKPHRKPIVTETHGPHGETVTSIITEITEGK